VSTFLLSFVTSTNVSRRSGIPTYINMSIHPPIGLLLLKLQTCAEVTLYQTRAFRRRETNCPLKKGCLKLICIWITFSDGRGSAGERKSEIEKDGQYLRRVAHNGVTRQWSDHCLTWMSSIVCMNMFVCVCVCVKERGVMSRITIRSTSESLSFPTEFHLTNLLGLSLPPCSVDISSLAQSHVCLAPLIISLSRYSLGFRPVFSGVRENHVSFVKTPHTNTTRFILQVRPVRPADVAGLSLPLACSLPCLASICTHPPFCCA